MEENCDCVISLKGCHGNRPTGGGWPPLTGKCDSLELAYELLDSIEIAGTQLPSSHTKLLNASIACPERSVDFSLD